jgi:hypothetical protein
MNPVGLLIVGLALLPALLAAIATSTAPTVDVRVAARCCVSFMSFMTSAPIARFIRFIPFTHPARNPPP